MVLGVEPSYGVDMDESPRAVVETFFDRMADPDRRSSVGELFSDDAIITLPGVRFEGEHAAEEMLEWLAPRYEWVEKDFDRWLETGDHVVSQGTLYGVNNDGEAFDGVRYVDVYKVEDGQITRVDIYNDLAATGVLE